MGDFFTQERSPEAAGSIKLFGKIDRITSSQSFNKINLEYNFIRLIFVF